MKTNTRPLNMDEKKKFESIVHSDIDKARAEYQMKHSEKREALTKELTSNAVGLKLLAKYVEARKTQEAVEKDLRKLGFVVYTPSSRYNDNNEDKPKLQIADNFGSKQPKEILALEKTKREVEQQMEDMKRSYTLKLFGGDTTEALEIFESLRKDLQALIK